MKRSMRVLVGLALVAIPASARGGVIVTLDAPGVQASQVSRATTETFDGVTDGTYTSLNTSVGTLSGAFTIDPANIYGGYFGGAGGDGSYIVIGPYASATVTFNHAEPYFGLWWSAADPSNQIELLSNGSVVATFDSASALAGATDSAYYGNPNDGHLDGSEKFAYVNFVGTGGTTFNQIVFSATTAFDGKFEADNFSVLAPAAVPEPSSLCLVGFGIAATIGCRGWRRRSLS